MKLLISVLFFFNINVFAQYDEKLDCYWGSDGCSKDGKLKIDLRSKAKQMLDSIELEPVDKTNLFTKNSNSIYSKKKFSKVFKDSKVEYFIPINLSEKEKIVALASASLGLIAFQNDQEILDFVQDNKTQVTQDIEDFGYYAGRDGIYHLAAGSYFLGAVLKNGKLKELGILTVATGMVSQTITEGFKQSFGRERPKNANGDPYKFGTDGKSFFSGHASGAFGTAAVLAELYKDTPVPYIAYGVAGLVAYARVHAMGHYTSDVIYGALAGYLSAKLTLGLLGKEKSKSGLLITPSIERESLTGQRYYALNMSWQFNQQKTKIDCKQFDHLHKKDQINLCVREIFKKGYQQ